MAGLNHYTELLYYIKELADSDPLVNKVTQGEIEKIDLNKMTLFPLVHISITGGSFSNGSTVLFNVQLGAMAVRDVNKKINTDEFFLNDNEVDNLNDTLAILNRIWTRMATDFASRDIVATENPNLEIFKEEGKNTLDGWVLNFDVELPNNVLSLCQYPLA